jgi:hypothetical protein
MDFIGLLVSPAGVLINLMIPDDFPFDPKRPIAEN